MRTLLGGLRVRRRIAQATMYALLPCRMCPALVAAEVANLSRLPDGCMPGRGREPQPLFLIERAGALEQEAQPPALGPHGRWPRCLIDRASCLAAMRAACTAVGGGGHVQPMCSRKGPMDSPAAPKL
mmetsp:Transcript_120463/g.385615  ORF Transcript_120463/g.385615 Transcript_120463/m.385615 type:complete len:127 (-) Transcript_120463:59-439(-)